MLAAAAAVFAACSNEELVSLNAPQAAQEQGIGFEVYTQRNITRAGKAGDITTTSLKTGIHNDGFGVFAYYTSNSEYDTNSSTPNFMYNEQVKWDGSKWAYEPVKYWPNEFGDAAISDDLDKVTFFAYAPYIPVTVTTGIPTAVGVATTAPTVPAVVQRPVFPTDKPYNTWLQADWAAAAAALVPVVTITDPITDAEKEEVINKMFNQTAGDITAWNTYYNTTLPKYRADKLKYDLESMAQIQKTNITQLTKNTATGDPVVKYVVDTKPFTSVDLLWGVAADNTYEGMNGKKQEAGCCFVDLTKQKALGTSADSKLKWNFKHALAKLNVQIIYAADVTSADPTGAAATTFPAIDDATKVWLRQISFTGFTMKGALNLHSEDALNVGAALPNWKNIDGESELNLDEVIFYDGLKEGKEGTTNNVQKNETPTGLNINLTQTDALSTGVTNEWQNLFYGSTNNITAPAAAAGFYVIPTGEQMDVTIVYDVETVDPKLTGVLSDGSTHGSAIENKITKLDVLDVAASASDAVVLEPGKQYTLKIILGLESVKFDVVVTPWTNADESWTNLPVNP